MRDIFNPSRRKIGVVTLVMACAFMGISLGARPGIRRIAWPIEASHVEFAASLGDDQIWFGKYRTDVGGMNGLFRIGVSYWSIVVPLTAISAYLLLSKPPRADKPELTLASGESNA